MKKYYTLITLLFLFISSVAAQTLEVNGSIYSVDTLENHQVGPGTNYLALRLKGTGSKAINVFLLKTDLNNPYVEIKNVLGRDSIYGGEAPSAMAKRKSTDGAFYFAGTNGDFYNTSDYVGYPTGGNMVNSEIAKTPTARNVFAIDESKKPYIGYMSYAGEIRFGENTWTIHSANHTRGADKMVLYNQLNGKFTHTNAHGTEVQIELLNGYSWGVNKMLKAKVVSIEKSKGNMTIPAGQAVLSGHGTSADNLNLLSVGDEIELGLNISLNENANLSFAQMTAGDNYSTMLLNGVVEQSSVWDELHPRTGLGYTQNRDSLILCVVDGRSGVSNGVTTKGLAEIMKSAGAYTALNMDGGGSSCMYVTKYGQVNVPSDGNERAVCNGVFVVSNAPADNKIGIVKPYKPVISIPRYGEHIPQFYAYNQYGVLLEDDLQGVILSCPESLGTIEGNKFIATGNTPGAITATYNGNVTAEIQVNFVLVSEITIRLDSVIVDSRRDYPVEVVATTAHGSVLISPAALSWTVENPAICNVENGVVKALENGVTTITGEIDGTTDNIKIIVENPSTRIMTGDKILLSDWKMSATSQYSSAQFNQENLPQNWEYGAAVNFTHGPGRSPAIKLSASIPLYGLPDTVKIVLNTGDIAFSKAIVSLKANNGAKTVSNEITSFEKNKDYSLDIPADQLFDVTDRGIYPLWFDNVNFYIETSGMTEKKAYTLAVKELQLVYNGVLETSIPIIGTANFYVYPNPVINETIYLQLKESCAQTVRTEIYNLSGQLLMNNSHGVYDGNAIGLSIKNFTQGTYLLKVFENEKSSTMKLVVK